MTDQHLHGVPVARPATGDAVRTLALILATVVIGTVILASVPDAVWSDLSAHQSADLPDWHGNVAASH